MSFSIYKARDIDELVLWLNGGIQGVDIAGGVMGLVGKTLSFTSPEIFTVTFVATTGDANNSSTTLKYLDIKTQIEAASALVLVTQSSGRLWISEKTPLHGVALAAAANVTKAMFGFDSGTIATGRVVHPMGSDSGPRVDTLNANLDGSYTALIWEGNNLTNAIVPAKTVPQTPAVATSISAISVPCTSVLIQADLANTGTVYVNRAGVTIANGGQLLKGDSLRIKCSDASEIFCVGSAVGDKLLTIVE